jgi:transposase-like protein
MAFGCGGLVPTGTVKTDRRRRRRKPRKGKRLVLLVALGRWTDGSGRREILDWELAEGATQPDWQRLLDRLWERGVRPEAGLQAIIRDGKGELGAAVAQVYGTRVIEQRCVFHKLRNVADKAREDLSGEGHREQREQLLEQASAIYQAETAAQAHERLSTLVSAWQEQAPKAVATLQRDFEQTIAFYRRRRHRSRARAHHVAAGTHELANCAASFAKPAALAVAVGLRSRSICKCSGCMPAGPTRPGHKSLGRSLWLFTKLYP